MLKIFEAYIQYTIKSEKLQGEFKKLWRIKGESG